MDKKLLEALEAAEAEWEELGHKLADPSLARDPSALRQVGKKHADLTRIVTPYRQWQEAKRDQETARSMLKEGGDDQDLRSLAEEESERARGEMERLEEELRRLLAPRPAAADKNAIMEIRAGTGGGEAALWARDLFRMYSRYAEAKGWKVDVISAHPTGLGGFKEVVFAVEGKGAYGMLLHESGVHRVQRVPETEASGRLHTSAASVAVLPEAQPVEVRLSPDELEIETYRARGAGGQHVQKNETAVRVRHLPTGLVVTCEDERSQLQNKERALRLMRARVLELREREQQESVSAQRREQIRTGDRSDKIRTYNFPQNRVTDHRIGVTFHGLKEEFLEGGLDDVLEALQRAAQQRELESAG